MLKRLSALLVAISTTAFLCCGVYAADTYPSKPIKMIVGFQAGGSSDAAARVIARELQQALGTPVIVENLPGGGGRRAFETAFMAPPDGYTLLLADMPSMQVGEIGYRGKYKTGEFTYLEQFFSRSHAVAVRADSPIKSFQELVATAKQKRMTFSSPGMGTTAHLQSELMRKYAGLSLTQVPYDSGTAATAALLGGNVEATISGIEGALTSARAGHIRILAVLFDERIKAVPDVPTLKELGYAKAYFTATVGILAPPKLPPHERDALTKALGAIATHPAVMAYADNAGTAMAVLGADEYLAKTKQLTEVIAENIDVMKAASR
jgi:tripartite-type tricarboxylate transporter receptor subunit TctC